MASYFVQLVTFAIALSGTFYKCVREDAEGRRVYWKGLVPSLTVAGRLVFVCLTLSLGLSLWITYDASLTATANKSALVDSLKQQRTLSEQLASARKENLDHFNLVINGQLKNMATTTNKLRETAELVQRRVIGSLTTTKSFDFEFFVDGLRLGDDWERDASIENRLGTGGHIGNSAVLRKIFCGFYQPVESERLQIPIASNPVIEFILSVKKPDSFQCELIPSLVVAPATTNQHELELRMAGLSNLRPTTRAVFDAHISEQQLDSFPFHSLLNADSFVPDGPGSFSVLLTPGSNAKESVKYLSEHMPSRIGFNVIPNNGVGGFRSAWTFVRQDPSTGPIEYSSRFIIERSDSNWQRFEFLRNPNLRAVRHP